MTRAWRGWLLAVAVAGVLAVAIGCGGGSKGQSLQAALQEKEGQLSQAQRDLTQEQARTTGLLQEAAQAKAAQDNLQKDLKASEQQVEQVTADLRQAKAALTQVEQKGASLEKVVDQLTIDRLILVELRKDLPTRRQAALDYWKGVRGLAAQSDTVLGTKANQVLQAAPDYFDWQEATFSSQEEQGAMYNLLGAKRYDDLVDQFRNEALLVVVRRLDAVSQVTGSLGR